MLETHANTLLLFAGRPKSTHHNNNKIEELVSCQQAQPVNLRDLSV
jgi:hypothetical protein